MSRTTFIQHSPSHSNHTVKEIKSIQTGKEIKSSLFTYDMKENPNVSTKKTVRTNEFSKVVDINLIHRNMSSSLYE